MSKQNVPYLRVFLKQNTTKQIVFKFMQESINRIFVYQTIKSYRTIKSHPTTVKMLANVKKSSDACIKIYVGVPYKIQKSRGLTSA